MINNPSASRACVLLFLALLLGGCGVVHGVGHGVEKAGEGVQDASNPNEPDER